MKKQRLLKLTSVFAAAAMTVTSLGASLTAYAAQTADSPSGGEVYVERSKDVAGDFECIVDNNRGMASIVRYIGSASDVWIPDTIDGLPVKLIGANAFMNCSSIVNVHMPDTVETMYSFIFSNCANLETVELSKNLKSMDQYIFHSCPKLKKVELPDSLTSLEHWTFQSCSNLEEVYIPSSITDIKDDEFMFCSKVTIKGHKGSAAEAFANRKGIPFIDVDNNGNDNGGSTEPEKTVEYDYEELGNNTIAITRYNGNDTNVVIPSEINGAKVVRIGKIVDSDSGYIGYRVFNSTLVSVTIPDSVTSIGNAAFSDCSSLTSIKIPDSVTSIGNAAFNNCRSLTSITIPDSVTSIGWSAFEGCSSLTSITFSDSVTSIDDFAFMHCSSLTSINIPNSVTSIGDSAFQDCGSLKSINIPDSVTDIGWYAFEGCSSLKSLRIPDSVTSIGDSAFESCESLTSLRIPKSVTSIGSGAFSNNDPDRTLKLYEGSYAEQYAKENIIPYTYIDENEENKPHYGDLDDDGEITANDALTILRSSVGMATPTPEQIAAADVDGDGNITANDALAVLRHSVGMGDGGNIGEEITA